MMFRGLLRASLSNNSEESSQIFCRAPKEPWKTQKAKRISPEQRKPTDHHTDQADLAGAIVLRVEQIAELRQQFWPGLQLSFRGYGRDQDPFMTQNHYYQLKPIDSSSPPHRTCFSPNTHQ